ncbi:hypothetical protein F2Q68_00021004 [Brassica cretica]|uniref:Uncharacterized protein n=1 Tax=Brassica cretica TaxID=69181 RepID=A0A8S9FUY1_BRACR|nr:hypothetical protein F2Q68_00021004 [Brassica cretica]
MRHVVAVILRAKIWQRSKVPDVVELSSICFEFCLSISCKSRICEPSSDEEESHMMVLIRRLIYGLSSSEISGHRDGEIGLLNFFHHDKAISAMEDVLQAYCLVYIHVILKIDPECLDIELEISAAFRIYCATLRSTISSFVGLVRHIKQQSKFSSIKRLSIPLVSSFKPSVLIQTV